MVQDAIDHRGSQDRPEVSVGLRWGRECHTSKDEVGGNKRWAGQVAEAIEVPAGRPVRSHL